jgi:glutamate racemase
MSQRLPIGVFDSGVGGLTVALAVRQALPHEDILYLGDTARVPYGTRSPQTVQRYAERVAGHLVRRGIKALVVACNTATTYALPALREVGRVRGIPVIGVIEPGVHAALARTRNKHVGIIGTEGTIRGGVYRDLLNRLDPEVQVHEVACPLFVSLAEEGWTDGEVAFLAAKRYLAELQDGPDTLILGCTHYPLLRKTIGKALPGVVLVDSARATALEVTDVLDLHGLHTQGSEPGQLQCLVTDNIERFVEVGTRFMGKAPEQVELVDLAEGDSAAWKMGGVAK